MKIKHLLLTLFLFFLTMAPTEAVVPKLLSYQGVLKDGSGNFLTGTYSMTFRLYSASTGGSALWTETQSSVSASSGKFSVQLGSVTTISLDFNSDYWLSIQVGADAEMSPRIRLTSMAYGIRSDYENNGFTQSSHDGLTHKGIEGVKDNASNIAKTNFKLDAYSLASANSMGELIIDSFNDSTGINSGASSDYVRRGSPNYDVVSTLGGIDSSAKLVLHANGTNGSTTFADSSSGAKTVTANGDAQVSTTSPKFGSGSCRLDGTGDYLSTPDNDDFDFGSGDFTVDFWVKFDSAGTDQCVLGTQDTSNLSGGGWGFRKTETNILFYIQNTAVVDVAHGMSNGTWYHIAGVRSGTNCYLFRDGTQIGSTGTSSASVSSTNECRVGRNGPGGTDKYMTGNFDEIRISKGVARWTTSFTPPAGEYSNPSGSAIVVSNAYSEPAAPTEVLVTADETLNSGSITYSISRDNGTTWTQVTKDTVTSVSSQPSGTQLKWKAAITGDAELNAIGVAV